MDNIITAKSNIVTWKIKYTCNDDFKDYIIQYNNVLRFTYNRIYENKELKTKEITKLQKSINNQDLMNSHLLNSCIYDCCDDPDCEYCQGGVCLIDDYGEKIFNHILHERCCSVGKYQMDYNEAKHIMALYEKYKNNPKQVEFILKLQGEE